MPELPEVQTVVTTLNARLPGLFIANADLVRPDILFPVGTPLPALLIGRRIAAIDRRGKKIVFTLDNSDRFYIHLGMTGRLTLSAAETPTPKHTHLRLRLSPAPLSHSPLSYPSVSHALSHPEHPFLELRFTDPRRFGGIWWLGATGQPDADLGPEPLTLRSAQFSRLVAKTTRPIKSALLDQKLIAGLGNIYVDEALHAAGIHPLTPASQLSPAGSAKLCRAIKTVLRRAIRHNGSTLRDYRTPAGEPGEFQRLHRVYARTGQPCLTCKSRSPIVRIVLSARSTHFCPTCQPPLRPSSPSPPSRHR